MAFKRPRNECNHCGHSWRPRGQDVSSTCPNCRREISVENYAENRDRAERKRKREAVWRIRALQEQQGRGGDLTVLVS